MRPAATIDPGQARRPDQAGYLLVAANRRSHVASPDEGQFILECKQTGHIATSSDLFREMPTFELIAYTVTNGRRKIAWSATKTSVRYPPTLLTRDFINALKKARGEKK